MTAAGNADPLTEPRGFRAKVNAPGTRRPLAALTKSRRLSIPISVRRAREADYVSRARSGRDGDRRRGGRTRSLAPLRNPGPRGLRGLIVYPAVVAMGRRVAGCPVHGHDDGGTGACRQRDRAAEGTARMSGGRAARRRNGKGGRGLQVASG